MTNQLNAAGVMSDLAVITSHGYTSSPSTPLNTTLPVWITEVAGERLSEQPVLVLVSDFFFHRPRRPDPGRLVQQRRAERGHDLGAEDLHSCCDRALLWLPLLGGY
jgi:hypothetical protein